MHFSKWADSTPPMSTRQLSTATLNSHLSSEMGICTVHWCSSQSAATSFNIQGSKMTKSAAEWWAEVHPAPIKTTARMREKLAKYGFFGIFLPDDSAFMFQVAYMSFNMLLEVT
jgi:hypothetical protein